MKKVFSISSWELIKDPSFKETFDIGFCFAVEDFSIADFGQNVFVSVDRLRHVDTIAMGKVFSSDRFQNWHALLKDVAQKHPAILVSWLCSDWGIS